MGVKSLFVVPWHDICVTLMVLTLFIRSCEFPTLKSSSLSYDVFTGQGHLRIFLYPSVKSSHMMGKCWYYQFRSPCGRNCCLLFDLIFTSSERQQIIMIQFCCSLCSSGTVQQYFIHLVSLDGPG